MLNRTVFACAAAALALLAAPTATADPSFAVVFCQDIWKTSGVSVQPAFDSAGECITYARDDGTFVLPFSTVGPVEFSLVLSGSGEVLELRVVNSSVAGEPGCVIASGSLVLVGTGETVTVTAGPGEQQAVQVPPGFRLDVVKGRGFSTAFGTFTTATGTSPC